MMKKLLVFLFLFSMVKVARADVAPPPHANECLLLPIGATCYVEGRRGQCDSNVHPVNRHRNTCRLGKLPSVDAGDTSTNTAPAPTPEKSPDCSFAPARALRHGERCLTGALLVGLAIAVFFRRQKHDARNRNTQA